MSGDYRYQITEHQGIQCLHVIVEHDESDELHKAKLNEAEQGSYD